MYVLDAREVTNQSHLGIKSSCTKCGFHFREKFVITPHVAQRDANCMGSHQRSLIRLLDSHYLGSAVAEAFAFTTVLHCLTQTLHSSLEDAYVFGTQRVAEKFAQHFSSKHYKKL